MGVMARIGTGRIDRPLEARFTEKICYAALALLAIFRIAVLN